MMEPFVWSLLVILVAERRDVALLRGAAPAHRLDRLPLHAMHPLIGAVVLRPIGAAAAVENASAHPPDVEMRKPVNGLGGEGHAVIGVSRERDAVRPKRVLEGQLRRIRDRAHDSRMHRLSA